MPIDKTKYPTNWKEIVKATKEAQKHMCAFCGVKNYSVGQRENGYFMPLHGLTFFEAAGKGALGYKHAKGAADLFNLTNDTSEPRAIVIVLTVAHLNHDTTDNRADNLRALCQKCHLDHDKEYRAKNAKEARKRKKGFLELNLQPHE